MLADKNDPYMKQLMTGGVGSVMGRGAGGLDDDERNTSDQQPLWSVKLKLFGHCGVGKTTLVDSLRCGYIRALLRQLARPRHGQQCQDQIRMADVEIGTAKDHEGCTSCVDVQHITISGTGNMLPFIMGARSA